MFYESFGLNGPAFAALDSTEPLFLGAGHREGLAGLEWGLLQDPSDFTMLVGEIGTGKTTLIHALLANTPSEVRVAFINNPALSFMEILRHITAQFGLAPESASKLGYINALDNFVTTRPAGDSVAIIVDEAQNLADETLEELRLLSNARLAGQRRLKIVLVGQLELARRLARPQLRQLNQRIGARVMLRALGPQEVRDYVEYRLEARGGSVEKLFKGDAMREVVRLSGGFPRRINVLCYNAMVLAFARQASQIEAGDIREAARSYDHLVDSGWPWGWPPRLTTKAAAAGFALAVLSLYLLRIDIIRKKEPVLRSNVQASLRKQNQPRPAVEQFAADEHGKWVTQLRSSMSEGAVSPSSTPPKAAGPRLNNPAEHGASKQGQPQSDTGGQTNKFPTTESAKESPSNQLLPQSLSASTPAIPEAAPAKARVGTVEENAAGKVQVGDQATVAVVKSDRDFGTSHQVNPPVHVLAPASTSAHQPSKRSTHEPASGTSSIDIVSTEVSLGDAAMGEGNYDDALLKYRTALALQPGSRRISLKIRRARRAAAAENYVLSR